MMFRALDSVTFLDDLRIPYRRGDGAFLAAPRGFEGVACTSHSTDAGLWWPSEDLLAGAPRRSARLQHGRLWARTLSDERMGAALGTGWEPLEAGVADERIPLSIWRGANGIVLPFDPGEVLHALRSEGYRGGNGRRALPGPGPLLRTYYRVRPIIPRAIQIGLRRAVARVQAPGPSDFPAWPMETALHDMVRWLYLLLAEVAREPVPWIAAWPAPFDWAVVLTHDVETREGLEGIAALRAVEKPLGYRSSWNFVPKRYDVPPELLERLRKDGCEIGVHGLHHDGRDLASSALLAERLPEIHRYAATWGAAGFRSPATQRAWDLVGSLGFDYDSSYPDTDPYEPQPGGCCSWLPFEIGAVVELPITLPQDHTLFTILQQRDGTTWLEKARRLRERGGMLLALTHPDYQREGRTRQLYRELLEACAGDAAAWYALPREVSAWWRRRMASTLECKPDGWRVVGPAAGEAVVRFDAPR